MLAVEDFNNLKVPMEFGTDENNDITYDMEYVIDQLDRIDNSFQWFYGASKFVVIFNNTVIKIPFNGQYVYPWDEEADDYDYDNDMIFKSFEYTEDYCKIEASIYADATHSGLKKFFAGTRYAGVTKNGIPYYISEYVNTMWDIDKSKRTPSHNSLQKAGSLSFTRGLNLEWLACAIDKYGDNEVNRFLAFVKEYNITDLHDDNIGFRANGEPVLLDYSSYKE